MARNQRLTKEEIQEDKFIEGLLKIYAFLKSNLQTIIVAAVVVLVAVAAYAAYYQNQENRRAEATLALRQATEAYKTAEESLFDAEKLAESEALLTTAQTQLKTVFEKYANTTFADKARYQYANTLYYQGNYSEARTQFQQLVAQHQPENQMDSLYAQKAIGNTYEQEGDYENAIAAYQARAFPPTPQLSPQIRKFVLMEAKFNQALAYGKSGDSASARDTYKEIVDEFRSTLETGLTEKSRELIEEAKEVIAAIGEPLDADVSNPKKLEFVLTEPELNQALAHKKSGDSEKAHLAYHEIADEFVRRLEADFAQNSLERVESAKVVIAAIAEPFDIDIPKAEKLENEKRYFEAYVAYTDAIRTYKVRKDIHGRLPSDLRKQIGNFEKGAMTVINSIQNARRAENEGRESSALYSYDLVVELQTLGLNRRLYENALFNYKRLESGQ
ncbi:tetratricopeptide repeat protein [Candidatus Poribacteria bacterium]|nr:tetratricopeptide repeat protein [Candidatus Poribacteria bacterium]MYK93139.1 tetratricopeptide repeat protein [Candidatus Poribacteria bacterium]